MLHSARLQVLDAIRGLSLLGIHIANIQLFAFGFAQFDSQFKSPWDHAVRFSIEAFIVPDFFLLFAFVFGYSQALFVASLEASAKPVVPILTRRLVGLALIGVAHAVFLYRFDILTTYGVVGFALLRLRKCPDGVLLMIAIAAVLCAASLPLSLFLLDIAAQRRGGSRHTRHISAGLRAQFAKTSRD